MPNIQIPFVFEGIEIEKSGKVYVKVDLSKDAEWTVTFTPPTTLSKANFNGARYVDARQPVAYDSDVAWSISFASKLTVQAAKAALENNLSKTVEFMINETNRKVIFDGTYTARKGDVYLNSFTIESASSTTYVEWNNDVEYYVFVDWEEVGNTSAYNSEEIFSDVRVKDGASVSVKVEAAVTADDATERTYNDVTLSLKWEDVDGNQAWVASDAMKTFKTVAKWAVSVEKSSSKNTIVLKEANAPIASFTVKPANADDEITLENIILKVNDWTKNLNSDAFRVKVDNVEQYDPTWTSAAYTYDINEPLPSEWLVVTVSLKAETAGEYTVTVSDINGDAKTRTYKKLFVPAEAFIDNQEDLNGTTKFTLSIGDKAALIVLGIKPSISPVGLITGFAPSTYTSFAVCLTTSSINIARSFLICPSGTSSRYI